MTAKHTTQPTYLSITEDGELFDLYLFQDIGIPDGDAWR